MRGTRWLLLVAIAAILGGIGYQYRERLAEMQRDKPAAPPALPAEVNNKSQHWHVRDTDHATGRVRYDLDAEEFLQYSGDSHVDLKNVVLKLYAKDSATYDLVKSGAANFDPQTRNLYSEGDTEITIGVPI